MSDATMTAEALVNGSLARYLGLDRNVIEPGTASSMPATDEIITHSSPTTVPCTYSANSRNCFSTEMRRRSCLRLLQGDAAMSGRKKGRDAISRVSMKTKHASRQSNLLITFRIVEFDNILSNFDLIRAV